MSQSRCDFARVQCESTRNPGRERWDFTNYVYLSCSSFCFHKSAKNEKRKCFHPLPIAGHDAHSCARTSSERFARIGNLGPRRQIRDTAIQDWFVCDRRFVRGANRLRSTANHQLKPRESSLLTLCAVRGSKGVPSGADAHSAMPEPERGEPWDKSRSRDSKSSSLDELETTIN